MGEIWRRTINHNSGVLLLRQLVAKITEWGVNGVYSNSRWQMLLNTEPSLLWRQNKRNKSAPLTSLAKHPRSRKISRPQIVSAFMGPGNARSHIKSVNALSRVNNVPGGYMVVALR